MLLSMFKIGLPPKRKHYHHSLGARPGCSSWEQEPNCQKTQDQKNERPRETGREQAVRDLPLAYFSHCDFIFEVIRIERIDPSLRCLRLRIHKIRHRFVGGPGKFHVMSVVVCHPIHLP